MCRVKTEEEHLMATKNKQNVCCMQGLAFVGSELITFDAMTTYGLQAEWLAALLQVKAPWHSCNIVSFTLYHRLS